MAIIYIINDLIPIILNFAALARASADDKIDVRNSLAARHFPPFRPLNQLKSAFTLPNSSSELHSGGFWKNRCVTFFGRLVQPPTLYNPEKNVGLSFG